MQYKYAHYFKHYPAKLQEFSLFLYDADVPLLRHSDDVIEVAATTAVVGRRHEALADTCTFQRSFTGRGCTVETLALDEHGFRGKLFLPPGEGTHPGDYRSFSHVSV